jgi:S1-C subfamily serine protease
LVGGALRIRDDAAVALLHDDRAREQAGIIGFDPASRLAVIQAPFLPAPPPVPWNPRDPQEPRYLIEADISSGALSLRPVFVGSLTATKSPLWPQQVWILPSGTGLLPGSFVFTTDALLAGVVVEDDQQLAILPGAMLLAEAQRLVEQPKGGFGDFGVDVHALTPTIAKATGASSGIVVAHVAPKGPASDGLVVGDVLEAADGILLETPLHWKAQTSRLQPGQAVTVRVRRSGKVHDVRLVAAPAHGDRSRLSLGLELHSTPGVGSAIIRVEPGSIGDRAGLRPGDVITLAGNVKAPSPAAITGAVERASAGEAVLVAFVRGGTHTVTALEK